MEFPPEPQEFEWFQVNGRHGEWRMGRRVSIVREGASKMVRYGAVGFVLLFFVLAMMGAIGELQAGEISATLFVVKLAIRIVIALGAIGAVFWYLGNRTVSIDWDQQRIIDQRLLFKRAIPFSSLRTVILSKGPSRLVETSELRFVTDSNSIPFVETYYCEDPDERDALLVTLGRRLSETLDVPLQTLGDLDRTIALGMSDQELSAKYVEQGDALVTHASGSDMRGSKAEAQEYRNEAEWHFQYAHELDPDNDDCLLGISRLAGDHDTRMQAIELAVGANEDNVDALLERARLHQLGGNGQLAVRDFDRAVELEVSVKTLRGRGVSAYFRDRFEDALKDIDSAIEIDSDDGRLHHWRFNCWRRIYRKSNVEAHRVKAIEAIDCAIKLDPGNTDYQTERMELQRQTVSTYEESLAELNQLCSDNPDDWMLLKARGELHLTQSGKASDAVADFSELIRMMEKLPLSSGDMKEAHQDSLAHAYRLRSEAHTADGNLMAADRDEAKASQLDI